MISNIHSSNFHNNKDQRIDHIFFHKDNDINILKTKILFYEKN